MQRKYLVMNLLFPLVAICCVSFSALAQDSNNSDTVDIDDYLKNPGAPLAAAAGETTPPKRPRAFWGGGTFPKFKGKPLPKEEIIPTSEGYEDRWIGRSAGRPDTPPEAVLKAKREVEDIFENEYMAPPKESIASRFAANGVLKRNGKIIPPFEARAYLRDWVREDNKRAKGDILYSLPSYRMIGDDVRVKTTRVESSPKRIFDITVLFGKALGSDWKILEDSWNEKATMKKRQSLDPNKQPLAPNDIESLL